jgi:hypothetical protein
VLPICLSNFCHLRMFAGFPVRCRMCDHRIYSHDESIYFTATAASYDKTMITTRDHVIHETLIVINVFYNSDELFRSPCFSVKNFHIPKVANSDTAAEMFLFSEMDRGTIFALASESSCDPFRFQHCFAPSGRCWSLLFVIRIFCIRPFCLKFSPIRPFSKVSHSHDLVISREVFHRI